MFESVLILMLRFARALASFSCTTHSSIYTRKTTFRDLMSQIHSQKSTRRYLSTSDIVCRKRRTRLLSSRSLAPSGQLLLCSWISQGSGGGRLHHLVTATAAALLHFTQCSPSLNTIKFSVRRLPPLLVFILQYSSMNHTTSTAAPAAV